MATRLNIGWICQSTQQYNRIYTASAVYLQVKNEKVYFYSFFTALVLRYTINFVMANRRGLIMSKPRIVGRYYMGKVLMWGSKGEDGPTFNDINFCIQYAIRTQNYER